MIKVDLNVPLKGLDGTVVNENGTPLTCGKVLANQLASASEGDAIKMYGWAVKMYENQPVEVDDSDFKKMRDFTEASKQMSILAKAQILSALDECKDRSKK